jgi:Regulator of ribonuclease activity B
MPSSYPNDADGDALRNVVESGADMSCPMVIDFSVEVPDERTARRIAEVVAAHGFDPSISEDDDSTSWSVYCSKSMLATYEGVVAVQVELNELLSSHGGICDGWGTFGNTQK